MIIQTVSMQWTHHIFCYFVFRIHLSKFLFWPLSFCWRWLERDIFKFQVYFSIFKRKFTKLLLTHKKQAYLGEYSKTGMCSFNALKV